MENIYGYENGHYKGRREMLKCSKKKKKINEENLNNTVLLILLIGVPFYKGKPLAFWKCFFSMINVSMLIVMLVFLFIKTWTLDLHLFNPYLKQVELAGDRLILCDNTTKWMALLGGQMCHNIMEKVTLSFNMLWSQCPYDTGMSLTCYKLVPRAIRHVAI